MSRLSVSVGTAALAACLLGDLPRADAAEFKLKIGAGHPPVGLWVATIKDVYMPRVTERAAKAGHKIEWTEAWGGAVCKLGECLEAVEAGLLDIADVHAPTEPAKLLANNFTFFAPFGTPDPRIAAKVVWDVYQSTPALKKVLEDRYNQVFIANGIVGNYGLVTNFKWGKVRGAQGPQARRHRPEHPLAAGHRRGRRAVDAERGVHLDADRRLRRLGDARGSDPGVQAERGVEAVRRHGFRLRRRPRCSRSTAIPCGRCRRTCRRSSSTRARTTTRRWDR